MLTSIWSDIRFALRTLRKSPAFTAVAVLSLALGIGANTAIFSLLDQILLHLLPVKDPQQLALLTVRGTEYGNNFGGNAISYPLYRDFSQNNSVFSGMFARLAYNMSVSYGGHTERVNGELVSGGYFPILGVNARIGRTFNADDDRVPGGHPVAMLTYSYWKTRFNQDPSIIGKTIVINGHNLTVVGVSEPGFDGVELGRTPQIFVPIMMKAQMTPGWDALDNRRWRWVNAFGRLRPGVTIQQAKAALQPYYHSVLEMEVKEPAFRDASPDVRAGFLKNTIDVLPASQGRSYLRRQLTTPLWVLMAITGGVLLIACANIASLLVAKATSRQKEIAIRLAIGAGRGRIARQLLVESVLLAAFGGVAGLALAVWTDRLLIPFLPADTASLTVSDVPDWRALAFAIGISLITGMVFGLAPVLQSTRPDLAPTLKDQAGSVVGGGTRFRKTLVTVQVTLSLLLLVGSGLFIRSLRNLRDLGPGFRSENLAVFTVDPPLSGYNFANTKLFFHRLTDDLNAMPGVSAVGLASMRILTGNESDSGVTVEGSSTKRSAPYMNSISPGYFAALGVPMVAGRDFSPQDTDRLKHNDPDQYVPRVVIVNQKFAKQHYGDRSAIGHHVGFGINSNTKTDMEIIGVVKDIKYTNLRDEIPIQMFVPYLSEDRVNEMNVYVKSSLGEQQLFSAIRRKVSELDANLPLFSLRTVDQQITASLLIERLIAGLSTVFGALATLLATIGLYGVMAYTVTRRTREIGIRMALGAFQKDVIWMVMREVLLLVAIGVAAGLSAAIGLTRLVQSQLFGITPHDPITLAVAAVALTAVACAAGYIPAMRASRVDAMEALRYE